MTSKIILWIRCQTNRILTRFASVTGITRKTPLSESSLIKIWSGYLILSRFYRCKAQHGVMDILNKLCQMYHTARNPLFVLCWRCSRYIYRFNRAAFFSISRMVIQTGRLFISGPLILKLVK